MSYTEVQDKKITVYVPFHIVGKVYYHYNIKKKCILLTTLCFKLNDPWIWKNTPDDASLTLTRCSNPSYKTDLDYRCASFFMYCKFCIFSSQKFLRARSLFSNCFSFDMQVSQLLMIRQNIAQCHNAKVRKVSIHSVLDI